VYNANVSKMATTKGVIKDCPMAPYHGVSNERQKNKEKRKLHSVTDERIDESRTAAKPK
jgi:hypothetical protein